MFRFLVAILAGIGGAGVGLAAGWGVGAVLAEALDVSCFEGACGYFVAMIALLGGGIGLVAGILTALLVRRRSRSATVPAEPGARAGSAVGTIGRLAGAIAVIAGLAVGGVWLYMRISDDTIAGPNEATPQLHYEVRFPAETVLPDGKDAVDVRLDTARNQAWGDLFDDWRRRDGDRPVVAGFFDLYFRSRWRILSIGLPEGPDYLFVLKLPSAPGHMADYTAWYPVDFVDEGASDQPRKATGEDGIEIRYRVVYAGRD